jgi:hypothetical protein
VRFIDEHTDHRVGPDGLRWGVESICSVLFEHGCVIAPSTYYDARRRAPSRRALRDEQLKIEIIRVYEDNHELFGARKVWLILRGELIAQVTGAAAGRCCGWLARAPKLEGQISRQGQPERPSDGAENNEPLWNRSGISSLGCPYKVYALHGTARRPAPRRCSAGRRSEVSARAAA